MQYTLSIRNLEPTFQNIFKGDKLECPEYNRVQILIVFFSLTPQKMCVLIAKYAKNKAVD